MGHLQCGHNLPWRFPKAVSQMRPRACSNTATATKRTCEFVQKRPDDVKGLASSSCTRRPSTASAARTGRLEKTGRELLTGEADDERFGPVCRACAMRRNDSDPSRDRDRTVSGTSHTLEPDERRAAQLGCSPAWRRGISGASIRTSSTPTTNGRRETKAEGHRRRHRPRSWPSACSGRTPCPVG